MVSKQDKGFKTGQFESINKENEENDTEVNDEVQETDVSSQ